MTLTRRDAEAFAKNWIDSWNRGDIETVAGHYAEDCRFVSPRAAAITGHALVEGRAALLAYWTKGRALSGGFDFRLIDWNWDNEILTLVIRYVSAKAASGPLRAVEIMRFDGAGKIAEGEALYGART